MSSHVDFAAIKAECDRVIKNHVLASTGVGLIPVPLLDLVGLAGIQLNMLRSLAKAFGVPFFENKGKSLLGALVGGGSTIPIANLFTSLLKAIPIIGQTTGVLAMPLIAGASTYAVGKVFVQHFASGGTFLTFDPEKVKDYYAEMYKEGEKVASEIKE